MQHRQGRAQVLLVGALAVSSIGAIALISGGRPAPLLIASTTAQTGSPSGGQSPADPVFPVTINRPDGPPVVLVESPDGGTTALACSTCHDVLEPNVGTSAVDDLEIFHVGLSVAHGDLSCLTCHDPSNYDALRLADGTSVPYPEVMTLCGQCHGPQARSYAHGAHGGMSGYWDLTRGPRTRNNCVDCHHPHAPAFPHMQPTFKPRDRFLNPPAEDGHD